MAAPNYIDVLLLLIAPFFIGTGGEKEKERERKRDLLFPIASTGKKKHERPAASRIPVKTEQYGSSFCSYLRIFLLVVLLSLLTWSRRENLNSKRGGKKAF